MYSLTALASGLTLAPLAAAAAQAVSWPNFVLRVNVTEEYNGTSPEDPRTEWHNTPLGMLSTIDDNPGPLFDSPCGKPSRIALNGRAPYTVPNFFYLTATAGGWYAPSTLVFGPRPYRVVIAGKDQLDPQGRRAIVAEDCDGGQSGSSSLYISTEEPYHLVYDNKEADGEEFGSFYACATGSLYGDGLFYRSADEKTPEGCGELTLYPECMPLTYTVTSTQGTQTGNIDHDAAGAYNATCYVDVEPITGAPNEDVSYWMNAPRTNYHEVGHVSVEEATPVGY